MYVCVYIYMLAICMYACMYVCMSVCIYTHIVNFKPQHGEPTDVPECRLTAASKDWSRALVAATDSKVPRWIEGISEELTSELVTLGALNNCRYHGTRILIQL